MNELFGDSIPECIHFNDENVISALGLIWDLSSDPSSLKVSPVGSDKSITKCSIVSSVAKLFEPLGRVSPVVINAKILIQVLWIAGVSWGDPVNLGLLYPILRVLAYPAGVTVTKCSVAWLLQRIKTSIHRVHLLTYRDH